ncbi:MAG: carboxypeptidase-like regulatory domain-containing protein [Acidobacteriota bacterium]|nr:carboxypeptidase-like regulatory domain-containing protein [Acidobacteriota bacterium]
MRDASGNTVSGAILELRATSGNANYAVKTSEQGEFVLTGIVAGDYELRVTSAGKTWKSSTALLISDESALTTAIELSNQSSEIRITSSTKTPPAQAGGEHLSKEKVSSLPLNERDFSKLLLLAAGTMTDANGAANFTQQFAVNGQRGVTSVFAIDAGDTTDPELGGATFANFNVDAIQEVQSSSGVMPAEIGHGAAGFNNVITKSGTDQLHGSAFEFIRNAAFDARNFFDHKNDLDPRRIPAFARNEFGVTNGGPVVLPKIYDGRGKTYYFGEYQGFRQVLGTTQVFPVPTAAERQGIDTTSFPGDTLNVPVAAAIAPLLARYPLPNDPQGPYGARTYAASSKVVTNSDQFSVRVDHHISDKATLLTRFSLNQVNGPVTNPDQSAIDPSFGVSFFDHQRNAIVKYARTISARLASTTSFSYIRSTPFFPTINHTDPALGFGDGVFVGFNAADGSIFGSFGNVYQLKHDMSYVRGTHAFKFGGEIRWNKDATIFGSNPSGAYSFGGGTAYSPVFIPSVSGTHDILPGDPLPDALTGLLTATPYSYTITALARLTPGGDKFDEASVRREAYNLYFQDVWKANPKLSVSYGLRYDINTRIKESKQRTSQAFPVDGQGKSVPFLTPGAPEILIYNPQPVYPMDWNGWGPRLSVDYAVTTRTTVHAGGAITTLLPNLWQDNFVTGSFPLNFQPVITALPDVAVPFHNTAVPLMLPDVFSTAGQPLFPSGDSSRVPANTQVDLQRFQNDLAGITPGNEVQLFNLGVIDRHFRNGYIGTYTAGIDHDFGNAKLSVAYMATAGIHLPIVYSPNGFTGADPAFAPYTQFNSAGHAVGGFGPESIMTSGSHSSYHSLQTSVTGNYSRLGLSLQASYTFSKSLDDASAVLGGLPPSGSAILQTAPQNPLNQAADKGPSTFDVAHAFTLSLIQSLPFDRLNFLQPLGKKVIAGWQVLNITTLTTGPPFTVYSGIQQTGLGAGGADRPDLVATPQFSTSRPIREDYFGRGADNSSFFFIPINVAGGTGPNQGRFGTLGRSTFRGPGFHNFDLALIKDTPFGHRDNRELAVLQFRAELFNIFNVVNFGLPSNTVLGSGFGLISRTAGNSRQIQFSLKLIY